MRYQSKVIILFLEAIIVAILFASNVSASTPFTLGETIHASIDSIGKIDTYTFSTTENDRILIRVVPQQDRFFPVVTLRAPNGTEIGIETKSGYSNEVLVEQILPNNGVYTFQVYSRIGEVTGNYSLYISSLIKPKSPIPITSEQTISASIDSIGKIDTYTFSTPENDRIQIRVVPQQDRFFPVVTLRAPNGTEIEIETKSSYSNEVLVEQVLPNGVYTFQVYSRIGEVTGNYSIYFFVMTKEPFPTLISTPIQSINYTILDINKTSATSPEIKESIIKNLSNDILFLNGTALSISGHGIKMITVNGNYVDTRNFYVNVTNEKGISIVAMDNDGNITTKNISLPTKTDTIPWIEIITLIVAVLGLIFGPGIFKDQIMNIIKKYMKR